MKIQGQGSIRPKEKAARCTKWQLEFKTEDGARTRIVNNVSKREATKLLAKFREELEGEVVSSDTFHAYAGYWLQSRIDAQEITGHTIRKHSQVIRTIKQFIPEDMALKDLDTPFLRDMLNTMRNGGTKSGRILSGSYMRQIYNTTNSILRMAVVDEKIARNPLEGVPRPRIDTKERKALSPSEITTLLDKLDELPLTGYVMCIYTILCQGLRRGEACALMARMVNHDSIRVEFAVKNTKGEIDIPKSEAGKRTLPMRERYQKKCRQWHAERIRQGWDDSPYWNCNTLGGLILPENLYRWWTKNREALGAPDYSLHELRHSNLSMMARYMNIFDLQRWAGWSSIEPAKIYIHEDMASMVSAVRQSDIQSIAFISHISKNEDQARAN